MLNFQPLGGLGQIGSNMALISDGNSSFIIDCGILFPNEDFFDINYLIPDFSNLKEEPESIIITHGHEDHIGAITHLIKAFPNIRIYAPQFAKELILKKFNYKKISYPIITYLEESIINIGLFNIHPIFVNHSIPDTFGLLIQSSKEQLSSLSLFYVSDFKIDTNSLYEKEFNFKKLCSLTKGHEKKILMADSTNIMSSTLNTPSEKDVLLGLKEVINKESPRIFITSFSSNIHRIQSIINIAAKMNYKVVPYGRSMNNYIQLALNCEHLYDTEKALIDSKTIDSKKERIIVLLSGCQGDFRGSLKRVSGGTDSLFVPKETDQFIFSSKAIPGNEKKINNIINELSIYNCIISHSVDSIIHSSGHPGRNDLLNLYRRFEPTDIVPIHGETYFLKEHVKFIKKSYSKAIPHFLTNHDTLIVKNHNSKIKINSSKNPPNPILIHGKEIEIERSSISTRRKLACNGAIFLSIKKDSLPKLKIIYKYELLGLPNFFRENIDDFETLIENEIQGRAIKHLDKTAEELRISIRRFCNSLLGYKPTTIVHFV